MSVEEFISRVLNGNKPQTPSASTPYRQLKRHHSTQVPHSSALTLLNLSSEFKKNKPVDSTQPFDEGGRRIAPPSALSSTIGMRLFSTLDDGTGFTPVEYILDAWLDEGIENSTEILQVPGSPGSPGAAGASAEAEEAAGAHRFPYLQALNFDLDGKLSLSDLTAALENELLITKNGIHQAAVASFKAEIRHLLLVGAIGGDVPRSRWASECPRCCRPA